MRLDDDVRDVLARSTVSGNVLILPEQLERPLYVRTNKVLDLLGGAWNRKARGHIFADDPLEVVADAVATGAVIDWRKEYQFFETPKDLAFRLVAMAGVVSRTMPHQRVLEPSAGRGAIVRALHEQGIEWVYAYELMEENRRALLELGGVRIVGEDFLAAPSPDDGRRYDRIVANPPFTRQQDVRHVMQMFAFLAPGGVLVSVMSPSWRFRNTRLAVDFRALVDATGAEWEDLPAGTFKVSGTMVNTGFLVMEKAR